MPGLANPANSDLSRGFTVAQVAEKHGWTELMVWPLSLEGKDDLDRFKELGWGLTHNITSRFQRTFFCYVGVRKLGLTSASVAKELWISPSAVRKSIGRGKQGMRNEAIEKYLSESQ